MDEPKAVEDGTATSGASMGRRELIRRAAVIGGSLVWAAPIVQTLSTPAFAGSPQPAGADNSSGGNGRGGGNGRRGGNDK